MRRRALLSGWIIENNTDNYVVMKTKESGTFTLTIGEDVSTSMLSNISYSTNMGSTWVTTNNTNGVEVVVTTPVIPANGIVLWKGAGTQMADALNITQESDIYKKCSVFSSTCRFDVFGNIMRMLDSSSSTLSGNSNFACLFYGSQVVSAKDLVLPASTLTTRCYYNMFSQCTGLIDTPELPATTLAERCYQSLFNSCTNLTTAPDLPATTLAERCYQMMFGYCASLTTAPELSATTLAERCCQEMFFWCTALTVAPELPATTLAEHCYQWMFQQSGVVIAPELPATTLADYCYNGMFYNCTSLTTAPELPATTLADYCYQTMFYGCTSLTTAPELPATTLAVECYRAMFQGCTNLTSIKCLATDISATNCTYNWVSGVAASGTFTKAASMSGWTTGNNGIPSGWTTVDIVDYSQEYFTIKSLADSNTIGWKQTGSSIAKTIEVSTDKVTWTSYTSDTSGVTLATLSNGQKLYVRGNNNNYAGSVSKYNAYTTTGNCDVEGNILSLIYGDNFASQTTLPATYTFVKLFENCKIVNAKNLILPNKTQGRCYYSMFQGCTLLTTPPELTATSISKQSYYAMFYGCTSLAQAPNLPLNITYYGEDCFYRMFRGCTSLTKSPILAKKALATNCYYQMFYGCTNLNYVTMLATDISATDCLTGWLTSVAATGTFVKDASMTTLPSGASGIPSGWTTEDYEE